MFQFINVRFVKQLVAWIKICQKFKCPRLSQSGIKVQLGHKIVDILFKIHDRQLAGFVISYTLLRLLKCEGSYERRHH